MNSRRVAYLTFSMLFTLLVSGCAASPPAVAPAVGVTPSPAIRTGQHPYSTTVRAPTPNRSWQSVRIDYLLYLPESYGKVPGQQFPLILFLHGRGERGADLEMLKKHPLPKLLEQEADFPFIVVSPQRSLAGLWWSDLLEPLNALLGEIESTYAVDSERVYLTGLSMGGFGAWELALRYPDRFAAVVPIAGGYREGSRAVPGNLCALRDLPIWAFHGTADEYVPAFQSQVMVEALSECGGNIRFTLYEGVDHEGTWTRAYADAALYRWLLEQRRISR